LSRALPEVRPACAAVRAPVRRKRGAGRGARAGRVRPGVPLPPPLQAAESPLHLDVHDRDEPVSERAPPPRAEAARRHLGHAPRARGGPPARGAPRPPDRAAVPPEAGAASRELARRLETAVDELPAKQRAALLLSRVDGLAYRDVAEALGCSEGAVKALLFRATQSLKKTLREYL